MDLENKIICGDCLYELQKIPKESIDLIYLDPPFHSGKNYDSIWNNGYEQAHFDDTWYKDGQRTGIFKYIEWLEERVRSCYDVLKDTGSLYLHCDWHANHHIRLMLDKIFGEKNFQNEIVWHYRGRGMQKNRFQRKHDIILFYSKSDKYIFNEHAVKVPLDPNHISRYNKTDKFGKKYALIKSKGGEYSKIYLKEEGIVMDDVWDLPFIHGNESMGYPTQKPLALLERIIKASSNKGDVVLDPMCGGGTTVVSAYQLNRKFIGIDVSPTACRMMIKRLNDSGYNPILIEKDIVDFPIGKNELKKLSPIEFENWVRNRMCAKKPKRDIGIDGITEFGANFLPKEISKVAVQIKRYENVGRSIVEKLKGDIDIYEDEFINKKYGVIVGFSFSRDAINRSAEFKQKYDIDIKLITVDELIDYKLKRGVDRWS